jgi:hypothetical protein
VLRFVHALVFALVASLGIASGAHALGSETALRKNLPSSSDRVGALALEAGGTHQQNPSHATAVASECSYAARGALALSTAQKGALLQAGLQPFKNSALTVAGRALTKHPELVGLTKATLNQALRSPGAINAAAEGALGGILHSGTTAVRELGRFGTTLEIRAASGLGAALFRREEG